METKVCSKCEQSIPVSGFYRSKNTKDGYQPYCKPCYRANSSANYYDSREKYLDTAKKCGARKINKEKAKERRERYRDSWKEFLESFMVLGCSECGYNKSMAALDFHHVDPSTKEKEVSRMITGQLRTPEREQKVRDEIAKCILLCANCHREYHSRGKYD